MGRETIEVGRRERKKHLTRQELLAAGRRLFADKGLYESRIEDLSRQAGIAKGTLYGYFANKDELVQAAVTSGYDELFGHVHRAAQGCAGRRELVTRVVQAHLDFLRENPDLMRIFHQVRGVVKFRGPAARPLRRILANYLGRLARLLATDAPPGRGAARAVQDSARLLFGALSGVVSIHASLDQAEPSPGHAAATRRALVALVLEFERGEGRARPGGRSPSPTRRG